MSQSTKQSLIFVSAFIYLFTICFLSSQNELLAKSKGNPTKNNKFVFSPSVEQLPPNYSGDDIKTLYDKLKKLFPQQKDEFETTNDYTLKLQKNNDSVKDNIYVFTRSAKPNYNADDGILSSPIHISNDNVTVVRGYISIIDNFADRYYWASNSLGGTVKVSEITESSYMLELTRAKVVPKILCKPPLPSKIRKTMEGMTPWQKRKRASLGNLSMNTGLRI